MAEASMTPERLREIEERAKKATPGPWAVEALGEKGDGSNIVGVVYGPGDENCERPLSGWLRPFDDAGEEIDYYRDEVVAECEHRNRNSNYDSEFIAHARTDIPRLLSALEAMRAESARLREALAEIRDAHLGDCPAAMLEEEFARGHIIRLRRIAYAALSGAGDAPAPGRDALAIAREIRARSKAENRCEICDWSLAESADEGCVPGNCSFRPEHGDWRYRVERRREMMAALDASLAEHGETT